MHPVNIDFKDYLEKLNNDAQQKDPPKHLVHCEHLQRAAEHLYYNESIDVTDKENVKLLQRILTEKDVTNFDSKEKEWEACVNTLQQLFQNNSTPRAYIRDIEIVPKESLSALCDIVSLISIGGCRHFPELPGINTHMHYVGERGSFKAHPPRRWWAK